MADAAQIVEGMGADIVDVNMGCPVPKIAKHHAGCALMREPSHAAAVVRAMVEAVRIPVTVKMRAGWNDGQRNAMELARRVEDAGAAAVAIHGRTAAQSYGGVADWELVAEIAQALSIPVFGSGDCVEPEQIVAHLGLGDLSAGPPRAKAEGVLVGRGVLRNPWILAQAADLAAGRPARAVSLEDRGRFLIEYIELLKGERVREPGAASAVSHERWIVNKIRALATYFTKGYEHGSHVRTALNSAPSLPSLYEIIAERFSVGESAAVVPD
jgi:tRNA-dihydrouridine synthase B